MSGLPKLEGEIILASATLIGTFGGFNITIPAGRYFLSSIGSGGATRSFCDELEFQMETVMGAGSSTVTLDDDTDTGTGTVLISRSSNFAITWLNTAVRDLLGFAGNRAAASFHNSDSHVKYLWLPNCARYAPLAPSTSGGALESDGTLSMGTDGTPYALAYSIRAFDSLEFRHLRGKKVWSSVAVTNAALERLWRDVIAFGLRVRFHVDRAVDATFRTWVMEDFMRFEPKPFDERWTEAAECLWSIRWRVRETT